MDACFSMSPVASCIVGCTVSAECRDGDDVEDMMTPSTSFEDYNMGDSQS
jgi:hypothetical protein